MKLNTTMKSKIYIFAMLVFLSPLCNAKDSVWKQSQQFEAKGDYEKAAAVIKPWTASNDEYALLRYAYLKYMQGEYNDSIKYSEKAIELNKKSLDAKLGIALPYIAQQRWRQVKIYTRQVLIKSDWNYTAHERLMQAEKNTKKWHTLNRHAGELTTIYPSDAATLTYFAHAKAKQGDVSVASEAYKKVLMREPDNVEASTYLDEN